MRYKNGGITNPFIRCERITNPLERPRTEAFSIGFSDRDPTPNPSPSRGGERKLGRGSHPLRGEGLGVGTVLLALHLPQEVLPFRGGFRRGFGGVRGGVKPFALLHRLLGSVDFLFQGVYGVHGDTPPPYPSPSRGGEKPLRTSLIPTVSLPPKGRMEGGVSQHNVGLGPTLAGA